MSQTHADHSHGHSHTRGPGFMPTAEKLPGIRHIIAVGSGKGGVGKSTVAVNLALALAETGASVGLVDADVLGPSVPTLLGLPTGVPPTASADNRLMPTERHGIKAVSMGLLRDDDNPAVMRGPMVSKYLQMFIGQVAWGTLDFLILDLPPGTGDTQLTIAQSVQLSGAVIVTTPQDVSLNIARRGLRMFEKVQVPILGVVENMGTFTCSHCGNTTDIFSHGGGRSMSDDLGVPFLGSLPLDAEIVRGGDAGRPIVVDLPDSPSAHAYRGIATALVEALDGLPPTIVSPFVWNWDTGEGAPVWNDEVLDSGADGTIPAGIRQRDPRTLSLRWIDGATFDIDVRDLRLACPCALCVEEMSGAPLLDPASVRADVAPRTITSVGTYAFLVKWSDGHGTGIYTHRYLRELGQRLAVTDVADV